MTHQSFGQMISLKYPIYLDVLRGYLLRSLNNSDSSVWTNFGTEENVSIKIFNSNNRGSLKFILFDTVRDVFINGQYLGSPIIKNNFSEPKQAVSRATTSKTHPTTAKYYYRPLRSSQWFYYNSLIHSQRGMISKFKLCKLQCQKFLNVCNLSDKPRWTCID